MKKTLKIIGYTLAGLILILITSALLIRFVFKEQMIAYTSKLEEKERIELLRNATPYASDTAHYHFVYQQDTLQAQKIRAYFRLDTLLTDSSATTWNKALALAKFVASHIPHANQTKYPEKRNAIALWEYTRTIEPAFNCRLHSILLHELMLSEGITNRFVTCLPADTLDSDCHVVNLVWLPEQNKWAMIDSDMQAWISNPEGTPLSLAEMRERYISGSPMQINPLSDSIEEDFNYDYYRSYWAKNLYWFICWEETGYGKEDSMKGRQITLAPAGFTDPDAGPSDIHTTDAERFWAAPDSI